MALSCCGLGFSDAAGAGGIAARTGSDRFSAGAVAAGGGDAAAPGVARSAGALASDCTAFLQAGDSVDALALRHSNSSGLFGAIQEQCAMKSSNVQAARTTLS